MPVLPCLKIPPYPETFHSIWPGSLYHQILRKLNLSYFSAGRDEIGYDGSPRLSWTTVMSLPLTGQSLAVSGYPPPEHVGVTYPERPAGTGSIIKDKTGGPKTGSRTPRARLRASTRTPLP